jgi:hypothetical protein
MRNGCVLSTSGVALRLTDGFIRFVFAVKQCVSKCCEKFLKHSARASVRFAELNQQSMQGMGGGPPGGA